MYGRELERISYERLTESIRTEVDEWKMGAERWREKLNMARVSDERLTESVNKEEMDRTRGD